MRKPWQTKEWKLKRVEFLKDKVCAICGKKKRLVVHHPKELGSQTYEKYLSFEGCVALCSGCHLMTHKGCIRCKSCGKHWHKAIYKNCFQCLRKTKPETYDMWRLRKIELPCGKTEKVPNIAIEMEGVFGVCTNKCDPYDCEPFKKWYENGMGEH